MKFGSFEMEVLMLLIIIVLFLFAFIYVSHKEVMERLANIEKKIHDLDKDNNLND